MNERTMIKFFFFLVKCGSWFLKLCGEFILEWVYIYTYGQRIGVKLCAWNYYKAQALPKLHNNNSFCLLEYFFSFSFLSSKPHNTSLIQFFVYWVIYYILSIGIHVNAKNIINFTPFTPARHITNYEWLKYKLNI